MSNEMGLLTFIALAMVGIGYQLKQLEGLLKDLRKDGIDRENLLRSIDTMMSVYVVEAIKDRDEITAQKERGR